MIFRRNMTTSGLMKKNKESLSATPGPVLPKDLPDITVDYRGLLSYAAQKGVEPTDLTESEKDQFLIKRNKQEQPA
ncbi:MAG: hypothetical protein K6F61_06450 [Clostridiales bacterium]|nr:hypothetical protein [Clostridiales bacterium]